MDATWIVTNVVAPVVASVVGLVTAVVVPLVGTRLVGYLNRRWKMDIDEREQAKIEALAVDAVHLAEATVGPGSGKQKLAQALPALIEKAADAGIDIGEDVARAKIEKALTGERIKTGAK